MIKRADLSTPSYCDCCGNRLISKKSGNQLVLVYDGYDNYYIFDSWECAMEHAKAGKLNEDCGSHSNFESDSLTKRIRLTHKWTVTHSTVAIVNFHLAKERGYE